MEKEQAIRYFQKIGRKIVLLPERQVRKDAWQAERDLYGGNNEYKEAWDALAPQRAVTSIGAGRFNISGQSRVDYNRRWRKNLRDKAAAGDTEAIAKINSRRERDRLAHKRNRDAGGMYHPNEHLSAVMKAIWDNPDSRESRMAAMRSVWDDPGRAAEITSRIHTTESDAKRRDSIRRTWASFSNDERQSRLEHIHGPIKQAQAQRINNHLGENPKEALERMINDENLTGHDIAVRMGYKSPQSVYMLLKRFGVEAKIPWQRKRLMKTPPADILRAAIDSGTFAKLTPRQQEVLQLRAGLTGQDPKTLEEVGAELHMSRQGVQKIEIAGMKKLAKLAKVV